MLRRIHRHAKRHFETHYRAKFQARAHLVLIIDSLLVLAAASLLGIGLYFSFLYHPLRDDFRISAFQEGSPRAGERATAVVRLVNGGKQTLRDATLTVHLPPQLRPLEGDEAHGRLRMIEISTMPSQASAEYRFPGFLIGPPGEAPIYAHFTARGEDGLRDEKLVVGKIVWTASLIESAIEAPDLVVPGQPFSLTYRLKNGSDREFRRLTLKPQWPEGFKLSLSTPPVSRGAVEIGPLGPGDEIAATFIGVSKTSAPELRFKFETRWLPDADTRLVFDLQEKAVPQINAALDLSAAPKDASGPARQGETVAYVIRYANRGEYVLKNVRFSLQLDGRISASESVEAGTINALAPGESGALETKVKVRPKLSNYVVNPALRPVPEARFDLEKPASSNILVRGTGEELKIAGTARLETVARYFTNEGDQLGRGPLPPQAGKITRYWLFVSAVNGPTEIESAVVTMQLPDNVKWTGRTAVTAGGEPIAAGNLVIWTIGTLPPNSGTEAPVPTLTLELALTPTDAQIGKAAALLNLATFQAIDTWTVVGVNDTVGSLTTDLNGDAHLRGRSKVRK